MNREELLKEAAVKLAHIAEANRLARSLREKSAFLSGAIKAVGNHPILTTLGGAAAGAALGGGGRALSNAMNGEEESVGGSALTGALLGGGLGAASSLGASGLGTLSSAIDPGAGSGKPPPPPPNPYSGTMAGATAGAATGGVLDYIREPVRRADRVYQAILNKGTGPDIFNKTLDDNLKHLYENNPKQVYKDMADLTRATHRVPGGKYLEEGKNRLVDWVKNLTGNGPGPGVAQQLRQPAGGSHLIMGVDRGSYGYHTALSELDHLKKTGIPPVNYDKNIVSRSSALSNYHSPRVQGPKTLNNLIPRLFGRNRYLLLAGLLGAAGGNVADQTGRAAQ